MNTSLATQQIRLKEWAAIIQDRIQSGMTVDAYCDCHSISRNSYFYWLHKVKEAAITASGIKLEELTPPKEKAQDIPGRATTFTPKLTIAYGDLTIGISEDTPAALLRQTLEVIRDAK